MGEFRLAGTEVLQDLSSELDKPNRAATPRLGADSATAAINCVSGELVAAAVADDVALLADVDAAIRVALQQSAITGSGEPLVLALKQSDERLARYNQPRLERVRREFQSDHYLRHNARRLEQNYPY